MIISVTALGSCEGDAAGAAAKVVRYLDGHGRAPGGRRPQPLPELPAVDPSTGIVGYYADSVEGPGRWLGRGVGPVTPTGVVDPEQLRSVLTGRNPVTGEQLLAPRGSAARAEQIGRDHDVGRQGAPGELLSLTEAASLLGVTPRYLRRLAGQTEQLRARQAAQLGAGTEPEATPRSYLDAVHRGGHAHWKVTRAEAARFAAQREAPTAVVGYDLTFSVPKSVSILWAGADAGRRAEIAAAVEHAVDAGVAYLEDHAAYVQRARRLGHRGPRRDKAPGLVAASYTHATSRALDPQLHCHVVVANLAQRPDGAIRALDGRPLFAHAKTAGYLAAAELRHQLSRRLGVEWGDVERGVADVAGVSRAAIAAMSQRADAMGRHLSTLSENLSDELAAKWGDSPAARQMAAYETRPAKEAGVDPDALRPHWAARLAAVGFGPEAARSCYDRQAAVALVTEEDRAQLFDQLGSATGVTHLAATFDRRDVLQFVAQWAGDRLAPAEISDLADGWLATDAVVALDAGRRDGRAGDVIRRSDGQVVSAVDDDALYSTRGMLEVEQRIWAAYEAGRGLGAGVVGVETLEAVLGARPELGADQAGAVRSITRSGHAIQCILGPAGAGKTRALEAAARAWTDAGYQVLGAAVGGTQAEVLQAATGIPSSTVASLLGRLDHGSLVLDERSVVAVDEASTLANRDLSRLIRHCTQAGAALRLAGDPTQHSAVAAGGAWRSLLERHPDDAALLTESRRLQGPETEQVRLALDEYRQGKVAGALERLSADSRVVEADSPDELFDELVADWYVDRRRQRGDPTLAPSSMTAEHHHERAELNRRARMLLAGDGELWGPTLDTGEAVFQAGDEVIARAKDAHLRPVGGDRRSAVTNGLRGRVMEVRLPTGTTPVPSLVVDFERRGPVVVPYTALTRRLRPGVVGVLAHSYALTSHAAQGDTYEAGRHLASERSSRPGVYVGLSRGRTDVRLYMVRKAELSPPPDRHPELPVLGDSSALFDAVAARLQAERSERLASELDPDAAEVARLRATRTIPQLQHASTGPRAALARRALDQDLAAVANAACLHPDPGVVARLGSRPPDGGSRAIWDAAVGGAARYRAAHGVAVVDTAAGGGAWALGARPGGPGGEEYDRVLALVARAEQAHATRFPTQDLARELRNLSDVLALDPADRHLDDAVAASVVATERFEEAARHLDGARHRLGGLEQAPRRRRNAQGLEMARRDVAVAEHALAQAALVATAASQRVEAAQLGAEAQQPVRDRRDLVEAALDAQTEAAVAEPAPYLTAALGSVPQETSARDVWCERAWDVERYRHRELGLSPDDGPFPGEDPLVAAIGPEPDDFVTARTWETAAMHIDADRLTLELEQPDLGIEL